MCLCAICMNISTENRNVLHLFTFYAFVHLSRFTRCAKEASSLTPEGE